ncbi:MAG TPA: transposase [Methylotenera sp.]|nr:transposase [Methylotenera sp.]
MIIKPKPQQNNLRKGRYSQENQVYHITTTTLNRAPIFKDITKARVIINVLMKSDKLDKTSTLAFVIMPDHIYWLFQLNRSHLLSKVVQSIKSISAHQIGQSIWQSGFYDHAIRKDEDIQNVTRYIVANPIGAGIVTKIGNYPHWDAIWI